MLTFPPALCKHGRGGLLTTKYIRQYLVARWPAILPDTQLNDIKNLEDWELFGGNSPTISRDVGATGKSPFTEKGLPLNVNQNRKHSKKRIPIESCVYYESLPVLCTAKPLYPNLESKTGAPPFCCSCLSHSQKSQTIKHIGNNFAPKTACGMIIETIQSREVEGEHYRSESNGCSTGWQVEATIPAGEVWERIAGLDLLSAMPE